MNLLKSLSLSTFNKKITKNTVIHSMKTLLRHHSERSLKKKDKRPFAFYEMQFTAAKQQEPKTVSRKLENV